MRKFMAVIQVATLGLFLAVGLGACGGSKASGENPCAAAENPCAGAENPCAGGENPCGGGEAAENPCGGSDTN